MGKLIDLALRYRFLVLLSTAMVVVVGLFSMNELPIDAVPDVTPNQVLILTKARGLSPLEVEQLLTFPVESAMTGLPGITQIQSVSKNGLSYVAIYFRDNIDIYFARRLVMERLSNAREAISAAHRRRQIELRSSFAPINRPAF